MVCKACKFGFYDRAFAPDVGDAFTSHKYTHDPESVRHHSGWVKDLEAIHSLKPTGVFADIGCQFGELLVDLEPYSYTRVGVEISQECVDYLRKHDIADTVHDRDLLEGDIADESWDIVTMWNVLDLLPQPMQTLQQLYRILKPGGLIVVRLQNLLFHLPVRKLFNSLPDGISDSSVIHDVMFSPRSLRMILAQTGFEVMHVKPSRVSNRDPSQFRQPSVQTRVAKCVFSLTGSLTYFASACRTTLQPSIIAYARKPE